jgi:hypothetical protein
MAIRGSLKGYTVFMIIKLYKKPVNLFEG